MKYCTNCGVELSDSHTKCPLCGSELGKEKTTKKEPFPEHVTREEMIRRPPAGKTKIAFSVLSFIILTTILLLLTVDYELNSNITWSVYPILSLLMVWALITTGVYSYKRPSLMVVIYFFIISLFLLAIDLYSTGKLSWSLFLGIPIVFITFLSGFFLIAFMAKGKKEGFFFIGIFMFAISILCTGINAFINSYLKTDMIINWSLIVDAITVPAGTFFLYLHFGLKKELHVEKIFHF
ncbi:DUF6320 domain-containing protein [Spirochaetia bacterium 38H-sp]|uniref:DUF6320 domain-containing protein n=1 Tax=Rarispira pelagica TaxID=3141764 RepID=A0ABU9UAV6_9SPIR